MAEKHLRESGEVGAGTDGSLQEHGALLRRIVTAVEKPKDRGRLELAIAVILSLTTLATTWCGYQSRQWGSDGSGKQAMADTSERQAAEDTIVALQHRTFDAVGLLRYWDAVRQNDELTQKQLRLRMRPSLQRSLDASIAAGVLKDPTVAGPMQRSEYVLDEEVEAERRRNEARRLNVEARKAGKTAGDYVTLTLSFASVLFFGGITGTLKSRRVRAGAGCVALVLFVGTAIFLFTLPVYRSAPSESLPAAQSSKSTAG